MKTVSAKTLRQFLDSVLSGVQRGPITIEEDGVPTAVLLSPEDYMMLESIQAAYIAQFANDEADLGLDWDGRPLPSTVFN